MSQLSDQVKRVWLARYVVDFRKSHQGLMGEAYRCGLKPLAGDAVLFIGRDRKRLKMLFADGNGIWVNYKLFNKGTHKRVFNFVKDPSCKQISRSEISLLFDGASYTVHKTKE